MEPLLESILDASPLAIVAVDVEGRVTRWTPPAERLLGWRADEVVGRFMPWIQEADREASLELVRRVSRGERFGGVPMRGRRRDGGSIEGRLFTSPLHLPDAAIAGAVLMLEDGGSRIASDDRLANALAHDFNNLLTVIRGYSDLALRQTSASSPLRRPLMEVRSAALRADLLIRQLLVFGGRLPGAPDANSERVASTRAGSDSEAPARGSGTLLVVEDEPDVRAVMRDTLESAGYTVLTAADGNQAIEVSASHPGPIDLLLTDVVLPGPTGPELAGRLIVQRPSLRVLFISGYAPAASDAAVHALPGTGFVSKPFDFDSLASAIRAFLAAPRKDDSRAA